MSNEELGKIAYEAYMRDCRKGTAMSTVRWEDQGAILQQHWIAVAMAVLQTSNEYASLLATVAERYGAYIQPIKGCGHAICFSGSTPLEETKQRAQRIYDEAQKLFDERLQPDTKPEDTTMRGEPTKHQRLIERARRMLNKLLSWLKHDSAALERLFPSEDDISEEDVCEVIGYLMGAAQQNEAE